MKHLTETERDISFAAARAYRAAIRMIWAYPEPQWERDLEREFWAKRTHEAMEKEE